MKILNKIYAGKSGIYCIKNLINNKKYIGSSKDLYSRSAQHIFLLSNKRSHSPKLQKAVNKNHIDNFEISIVLICHRFLLPLFEFLFIILFNSVTNGYNYSYNTFSPMRGKKFKRIDTSSYKKKTKKQIEAARRNLVKYNKSKKGKPLSKSHRQNISASNMGRVMSEENKIKNRNRLLKNPINYWQGKKRSKKDRIKMSIAHTGKTGIKSNTYKKIVQLDIINGRILNHFYGAAEAAKVLNVSRETIKNCLLRKCKTGAGYKWRYCGEGICR